MGGWREATRLPAGGNGAREQVLQDIVDRWADRTTPVAGAPDWLWALPTPQRPPMKGFATRSPLMRTGSRALRAWWGNSSTAPSSSRA